MNGRWILVPALAALLLFGCGGGTQPGTTDTQRSSADAAPVKLHSLVLTLSGPRGPESAGLLMAEERGYFYDAGLEVEILSPSTPERPVQYVVDEVDDLGISHVPQVAMAREKGRPIIAVGSLIPQPNAAMIWLGGSSIHGIAGLKGKTIGFPGVPFQMALLRSVLARAGLTPQDVSVKNVGNHLVSSLIEGRVDAIFGGAWNAEGVELESRGLRPVVIRTDRLGIPAYEELVFIARTDRLVKEPQAIRGFMSALRRGTVAAIEDPEKATELITTSVETNRDVGREEMEAEVKATLPLLSRTGRMSPARANEIVQWMHGEGMIQGEPPASELLTNEYVR